MAPTMLATQAQASKSPALISKSPAPEKVGRNNVVSKEPIAGRGTIAMAGSGIVANKGVLNGGPYADKAGIRGGVRGGEPVKRTTNEFKKAAHAVLNK